MSSERKIVEYTAIQTPFMVDLREVINRYIKDGRQPLGGISGEGGYFLQAMVKYD